MPKLSSFLFGVSSILSATVFAAGSHRIEVQTKPKVVSGTEAAVEIQADALEPLYKFLSLKAGAFGQKQSTHLSCIPALPFPPPVGAARTATHSCSFSVDTKGGVKREPSGFLPDEDRTESTGTEKDSVLNVAKVKLKKLDVFVLEVKGPITGALYHQMVDVTPVISRVESVNFKTGKTESFESQTRQGRDIECVLLTSAAKVQTYSCSFQLNENGLMKAGYPSSLD